MQCRAPWLFTGRRYGRPARRPARESPTVNAATTTTTTTTTSRAQDCSWPAVHRPDTPPHRSADTPVKGRDNSSRDRANRKDSRTVCMVGIYKEPTPGSSWVLLLLPVPIIRTRTEHSGISPFCRCRRRTSACTALGWEKVRGSE